MRRPGAVVYEGPSLLDGAPIVVIVTGFKRSRNTKTGAMFQTWIMRADVDPVSALDGCQDGSVCGSCPQRQSLGGACYVVLPQAPLTIFRAYKRGVYADWTGGIPEGALTGRTVRFGSYGDPAAVPVDIWRAFLDQGLRSWTGYTHQWRLSSASGLRSFIMASVESEAEMREAHAAGWRTFRIRDEWEALAGEVNCPSARGISCIDCGLCRGSAILAKSIAILAHGFLLNRRRKRRALPVAC